MRASLGGTSIVFLLAATLATTIADKKEWPEFVKDAQQMKVDAAKKAVVCNVCKTLVEDFWDKSIQRHRAGAETDLAKALLFLCPFFAACAQRGADCFATPDGAVSGGALQT